MGVRLLFGEGVGDGDIQGLLFLAKWQTEKPSVAGAPSGMKDFFPTFWGCPELTAPSSQFPRGIASCKESQLGQDHPLPEAAASNDWKFNPEVQRPSLLTLRKAQLRESKGWLRPSLGLHCSSISPPAQSYSFSLLQVLIPRAHLNQPSAF